MANTIRANISIPANVREAMSKADAIEKTNWSHLAALAFAKKCRELGIDVEVDAAVEKLSKGLAGLSTRELRMIADRANAMADQSQE